MSWGVDARGERRDLPPAPRGKGWRAVLDTRGGVFRDPFAKCLGAPAGPQPARQTEVVLLASDASAAAAAAAAALRSTASPQALRLRVLAAHDSTAATLSTLFSKRFAVSSADGDEADDVWPQHVEVLSLRDLEKRLLAAGITAPWVSLLGFKGGASGGGLHGVAPADDFEADEPMPVAATPSLAEADGDVQKVQEAKMKAEVGLFAAETDLEASVGTDAVGDAVTADAGDEPPRRALLTSSEGDVATRDALSRRSHALQALHLARMYLPLAMPELKRAVILEDDVILQGDVHTLAAADLGAAVVGATRYSLDLRTSVDDETRCCPAQFPRARAEAWSIEAAPLPAVQRSVTLAVEDVLERPDLQPSGGDSLHDASTELIVAPAELSAAEGVMLPSPPPSPPPPPPPVDPRIEILASVDWVAPLPSMALSVVDFERWRAARLTQKFQEAHVALLAARSDAEGPHDAAQDLLGASLVALQSAVTFVDSDFPVVSGLGWVPSQGTRSPWRDSTVVPSVAESLDTLQVMELKHRKCMAFGKQEWEVCIIDAALRNGERDAIFEVMLDSALRDEWLCTCVAYAAHPTRAAEAAALRFDGLQPPWAPWRRVNSLSRVAGTAGVEYAVAAGVPLHVRQHPARYPDLDRASFEAARWLWERHLPCEANDAAMLLPQCGGDQVTGRRPAPLPAGERALAVNTTRDALGAVPGRLRPIVCGYDPEFELIDVPTAPEPPPPSPPPPPPPPPSPASPPPTKTAAELRAEERQAKREKGLAERAQRDREWRENREQWRKEQTKVSSAKVRRGGRHSADGVVDGTPMPSICRNPAIAKRVKKCQAWSVHA